MLVVSFGPASSSTTAITYGTRSSDGDLRHVTGRGAELMDVAAWEPRGQPQGLLGSNCSMV